MFIISKESLDSNPRSQKQPALGHKDQIYISGSTSLESQILRLKQEDRPQAQGLPGQQTEFKARVGNLMRPCFKIKKKKC